MHFNKLAVNHVGSQQIETRETSAVMLFKKSEAVGIVALVRDFLVVLDPSNSRSKSGAIILLVAFVCQLNLN